MTFNTFDDASSDSNIYFTILMIPVFSALVVGLAAICAKLTRKSLEDLAESNCHLDYKDRDARITAGVLAYMIDTLHSSQEPHVEIADEGQVVAIVPHRTGWESFLVGAKFLIKSNEEDTKSRAPWWYATDVLGHKDFCEKMQCIIVKADAKKGPNGERANQAAIDEGNEKIRSKENLYVYPTGNWAKLGQPEPPMIFNGAAEHAIDNNIPMPVVRLDGFKSLTNSFFSEKTRNSSFYRTVISGLIPNDVRLRVCPKIDFHLKEENQHLSREEKIRGINATLYAYARYTKDLSEAELQEIDREVAEGRHLESYDNRAKRFQLSRTIKKATQELEELREEAKKIESKTDEAMQTTVAGLM